MTNVCCVAGRDEYDYWQGQKWASFCTIQVLTIFRFISF